VKTRILGLLILFSFAFWAAGCGATTDSTGDVQLLKAQVGSLEASLNTLAKQVKDLQNENTSLKSSLASLVQPKPVEGPELPDFDKLTADIIAKVKAEVGNQDFPKEQIALIAKTAVAEELNERFENLRREIGEIVKKFIAEDKENQRLEEIERRVTSMMQFMAQTLGLDADQQTKFKAAYVQYFKDSVKDEKAAREALLTTLAGFLTEAQMTQVKEMMDRMNRGPGTNPRPGANPRGGGRGQPDQPNQPNQPQPNP